MGDRDYLKSEYDPDDDEWEETYYPPANGDEDDETISCPYCGKAMWEEAPQCPHCGNFISREDEPYRPKPLWIIVVVILLLLAWWLGIAAF